MLYCARLTVFLNMYFMAIINMLNENWNGNIAYTAGCKNARIPKCGTAKQLIIAFISTIFITYKQIFFNGPLHLTVLKSTANDLSLFRNKQDICWKIDFLNSLIKDNFWEWIWTTSIKILLWLMVIYKGLLWHKNKFIYYVENRILKKWIIITWSNMWTI